MWVVGGQVAQAFTCKDGEVCSLAHPACSIRPFPEAARYDTAVKYIHSSMAYTLEDCTVWSIVGMQFLM